MTTFSRLFLLLAALLTLSGCGKSPEPAHAASHHAHTAPHGGLLVEIGEHVYNLELVRDAATGKLTLFILDGHAENFIRSEAPSLAVLFTIGGETRGLLLRAVADQATGETVGNTSEFESEATDWLKGPGPFKGTIKTLSIRGSVFSDVSFNLP